MKNINTRFGIVPNKGDGKLNWLYPAIKGWAEAIDISCNADRADPPYFYYERATVSLLTEGEWIAKGRRRFIALEEYAAEKRSGRKKKKNGRVDLYIGNGDEEYIFEAKVQWLRLTRRGKARKNAKIKGSESVKRELINKMSKACDSAEAMVSGGYTRCAVVFSVVKIDAEKPYRKMSERKRCLKQFIGHHYINDK